MSATVIIASRDGSLVTELEGMLAGKNIEPTVVVDQIELLQLFHGTVLEKHERIMLLLDGDLQRGSIDEEADGKKPKKKKKKEEKRRKESTGMIPKEAKDLIEQHTSEYESTSLAERNAELVLYILSLSQEGQIAPVMYVSNREAGQLAGEEFEDITFVSESEADEGRWSTVIDNFLIPKK